MAHNGPVYGVKFSPFCSSIFITYGADWQIKIWMENIESPLLSLCYCVRIIFEAQQIMRLDVNFSYTGSFGIFSSLKFFSLFIYLFIFLILERSWRCRLVADQFHSNRQRQRLSRLHMGFCQKNGWTCHDVYLWNRCSLLIGEIFQTRKREYLRT